MLTWGSIRTVWVRWTTLENLCTGQPFSCRRPAAPGSMPGLLITEALEAAATAPPDRAMDWNYADFRLVEVAGRVLVTQFDDAPGAAHVPSVPSFNSAFGVSCPAANSGCFTIYGC